MEASTTPFANFLGQMVQGISTTMSNTRQMGAEKTSIRN